MKWLEEKHSTQQLVAIASIYVRISVRYASRNFLSHYTLHNFPIVPDVSRAITSEPPKNKNKTLVANSTAFAWRVVRLGDTRLV